MILLRNGRRGVESCVTERRRGGKGLENVEMGVK